MLQLYYKMYKTRVTQWVDGYYAEKRSPSSIPVWTKGLSMPFCIVFLHPQSENRRLVTLNNVNV